MKKVLVILVAVLSTLSVSASCIDGNCKDGKGSFQFKDGSIYQGSFSKSTFQGYGVMNYSNKNVYKGYWKNHKRSGKGTLTLANGDVYVGQFKENVFWGKGKYTYVDGIFYDGEWVNHLAHGKGVYRYGPNEKYEGSFFKGQFSGVGAFHYDDGSIYIGNWKDNKKNGEGKMHFSTGEKIHGVWKDDELIDRDVQNASSDQGYVPVKHAIQTEVAKIKQVYKDCTNTYCHNEVGELKYQDGSSWKGGFMGGQPQGNGVMHYADGNRYEGEISGHAPNGEGVMYFANGTVIAGVWKEGYPTREEQKYKVYEEKKELYAQVKVDRSDEVKIWAVIVGVSDYSHMPTLRYTDDDAYQIYAFLKSPEGGALPNSQIKLLIDENATRKNILSGMKEILLKADENDVVMMYYSGHGLPGMFLPIDFDGYRNSLSHQEVMDIFNSSKAKHKLCIADACHSGSLLASKSPFKKQINEFYSEYSKTNGGTALIMSSKSEEVSLETSGLRQGIFSHYLIRGLNGEADSNQNKVVTVSELFSFVDNGVRAYTASKQRPSIAGNYDENMPVSTVRD
ncbi:caspase family protein [Saprospiraceae bacterium]|nr:caspase family protein [Saprospiraceae bacterium]